MTDRRPVDPTAGWQTGAACASGDPDVWYPDGGKGDVAAAAMAVCRTCPVIRQCGDHAILHERHGIWGGLAVDERKATRRRLGIRLATDGGRDNTAEARREQIVRLAGAGRSLVDVAFVVGVSARQVNRVLRAEREAAA